ncbi:MAG: redoxin domain-containing protein [Ignavibacteria bacterium]|nr:redoxin domain-containing protein [Ignavibacteria bacterium]
MEKLYETFSKKGVAVVGINANKAEDVTMIAAHCKEHGFKFPVLKDRENKIADLYGALVTPETFVINPAGKLVYHGRIDDSRNIKKVTSNDLTDALEKLLSGKALTQAEARAFGCSIKRMSGD